MARLRGRGEALHEQGQLFVLPRQLAQQRRGALAAVQRRVHRPLGTSDRQQEHEVGHQRHQHDDEETTRQRGARR
ncbi:MAG: hypothetical protein KJ023_17130 [Burkholderiaceae bacterium]|nr:hypothetical protein [Burkholderiaceae bacterium]